MELKIKDLNKSYDDKEVLKDINFTFKDNCIYGLIGRNGAGKTTFMNAIDSVIKVNSGEFLLDDKELDTNDIGFVVSTPLVPEFLTGKEFVQFYIDVHKDKIENLKDIDYYFDLVEASTPFKLFFIDVDKLDSFLDSEIESFDKPIYREMKIASKEFNEVYKEKDNN